MDITHNPAARTDSDAMALLETGRVLHNEQIQVKIKAHDRQESTGPLNFKIRLDLTPSHHQVLLCDITDPQDPFFLYSLVLGESDFHSLKNEQRLLVDFRWESLKNEQRLLVDFRWVVMGGLLQVFSTAYPSLPGAVVMGGWTGRDHGGNSSRKMISVPHF